MPVPYQCQAQADKIEELKQERADLSAELSSASPQEKPGLARQIARLNASINALKPALDACISQNSIPAVPPPSPLASSFMGTMSLTTDASFAGEPFGAPTNWGLFFDGSRTQVTVVAFPDWVINTNTAAPPPLPWPFGSLFGVNITTISQTSVGSGVYTKAAGALTLMLTLRFDHSREFKPFYQEDSDLSITLATSPSGSPVTPAGVVTLAGSGVFIGGWLAGKICTMVVTGTLTPVP